MDINYIREFLVLAEEENFLQASERLFISQSTLSRHLQTLESELRIPLFDRTTRKVHLNEYGLLFREHAKNITHAQDAFLKELAVKFQRFTGELKIAVFPSMLYYGITDAITDFKKENPSCQITIIEGESKEIRAMLKESKCDIGFIRDTSRKNEHFMSVPFTEDRLVALLPAAHPLAECDEISLSKLKNENFLLLPMGTVMYHLCIAACKKAGFEPMVGFIGHRSANIIDLVNKNMGVSLLMKKPIANSLPPGVKAIGITPTVKTYINILYPKGKKLPLSATLFLNFVTKQLSATPGTA